MDGTYVALRPFQYGPAFPADMLDMHQVFEMRHQVNDEALLRLKFAAPYAAKARTVQCGQCGKKFTDEFGLNRHGKIRHTAQAEPRIKDDHLGKIDTNDPAQLLARAAQLHREMKSVVPADGYFAPNPDAVLDEAAAADERLINEMHPVDYTKTRAAMQADDVKVPEIATTVKRRVSRRAPAKRRTRRVASAPQGA